MSLSLDNFHTILLLLAFFILFSLALVCILLFFVSFPFYVISSSFPFSILLHSHLLPLSLSFISDLANIVIPNYSFLICSPCISLWFHTVQSWYAQSDNYHKNYVTKVAIKLNFQNQFHPYLISFFLI